MSRYEKSTKSRAGKIIGGILRWFFLMLLAIILVSVIVGWICVRKIIAGAPRLDPMMVAPTAAATYICDAEGNRVQKLTLPEANRDLVTLERIPADLQYAFVAIEDARFYKHNGIDLQGIVRAGIRGILRGSFTEGASTITQQLLKNSVFTEWTSETSFSQRLNRKIQEQYLALELEKLLTKDQILEDYLNTINLGAGCYGVQAAAFRYFGKDVSELTLSECAVIAAITQNPTRYNPLTNPEENKKRRKAVLDRMYSQHYIGRERYEAALADEDVYSRIQSNEELESEASSIYTWYQDALIDQVLQDLMSEKGYTYKQAYRAVYTGGLRIYSAQDKDLQAICDEAFADDQNFPAGVCCGLDYALSIQHADGEVVHYGNEDIRRYVRGADPALGDWVRADFNMMFDTREQAEAAAAGFRAATAGADDTVLGERVTITPQPQASLVLMEQATGCVRAVVGGRGSKEASLTLNRATYTTRQPGSTFKILAAFAPAIDACGKTLASTYRNRDFYYEDGTKVSNWDVSDYTDAATIREAIVRSINVVAAECITEITPALGYRYARDFGITTLTDHYESGGAVLSDVIAPLALGGVTRGVTNLELCGAYACIANGGSYLKPMFYTRVEDHQGNILLDATAIPGRTVLKESTAALLTDAMTDVIRDERGTAYGEIDLGQMPAAGKTGTTSDYRDIWFAGYTPLYTCCIWGGYDNNEVLPDEEGGQDAEGAGLGHTYVKVLWNRIMNRIHEGLAPAAFSVPSDIVRMKICRATGAAATEQCPEAFEELFALGTQPVSFCSVHGSGGLVSALAGPGAEAAGVSAGAAGSIFDGEDPSALLQTAGSAPAAPAPDITIVSPAVPEPEVTIDSPAAPAPDITIDSPAAPEQSAPAAELSPDDPGAIVIYSTDEASIPAPGGDGTGSAWDGNAPGGDGSASAWDGNVAGANGTAPAWDGNGNGGTGQDAYNEWDYPENNIPRSAGDGAQINGDQSGQYVQADPVDQYVFNEAPEIVIYR